MHTKFALSLMLTLENKVTKKTVREYVEAAIHSYQGGLQPPNLDAPDGDPMFKNIKAVRVRSIDFD